MKQWYFFIFIAASCFGSTVPVTTQIHDCAKPLASALTNIEEEHNVGDKHDTTKEEGDGIYDHVSTQKMHYVAGSEGSGQQTQIDRNVFAWYSQALPLRLEEVHIIDWGAGIGRFVPFFESRGARKITLIEPSEDSFTSLKNRFGSSTQIELLQERLGASVDRITNEKNTLHVCTFVINCISNLKTAFKLLARSINPGEHLFVVTNVFAPVTVVNAIKDSRIENAVPVDITVAPSEALGPPTTRFFNNEIIATGEILKDSVHTLAEYAKLWRTEKTHWNIISAKLILPDGFLHKILPGENFGDYRFVVLVMELIRR